MSAKTLLRIASSLMFLHTIGHTMGALSWKNAPNQAVKTVIEGMQNNHFVFMGRSVSLADFYAGYGFCLIGVLLLLSSVLWLLSNDTANRLTRQLCLAMGLFLLFFGLFEYIYFFPLAAIFSTLAGISTLVSVKGNKLPQTNQQLY